MKIGIIAAMQIELDNLKKEMTEVTSHKYSNIEFLEGKIKGVEIVAAVCGIGKVFAAICTQTMILKFNPDMIINVGVAGTLSANLGIKDVAIASNVVQHDMDTSPLGDPVGLISGINKVELPVDTSLLETMEECVKELGYNYEIGTIASGDQFIHEKEKKDYISGTFKAIAAEMEGASIGHVCYVNKVPFIVLRTISDGDGGSMDYSEFVIEAAVISNKIIIDYIDHLIRTQQ